LAFLIAGCQQEKRKKKKKAKLFFSSPDLKNQSALKSESSFLVSKIGPVTSMKCNSGPQFPLAGLSQHRAFELRDPE
jgi:hypothetical protein